MPVPGPPGRYPTATAPQDPACSDHADDLAEIRHKETDEQHHEREVGGRGHGGEEALRHLLIPRPDEEGDSQGNQHQDDQALRDLPGIDLHADQDNRKEAGGSKATVTTIRSTIRPAVKAMSPFATRTSFGRKGALAATSTAAAITSESVSPSGRTHEGAAGQASASAIVFTAGRRLARRYATNAAKAMDSNVMMNAFCRAVS